MLRRHQYSIVDIHQQSLRPHTKIHILQLQYVVLHIQFPIRSYYLWSKRRTLEYLRLVYDITFWDPKQYSCFVNNPLSLSPITLSMPRKHIDTYFYHWCSAFTHIQNRHTIVHGSRPHELPQPHHSPLLAPPNSFAFTFSPNLAQAALRFLSTWSNGRPADERAAGIMVRHSLESMNVAASKRPGGGDVDMDIKY